MNTDTIESRELVTPFDFLDRKLEDNTLRIDEDQLDIKSPTNTEPESVDEETPYQEPEEVDTTEEVGTDFDVKIKGNLAKYGAEALKIQGALPEDFEITDDITEQDIDSAYVKYKEEPLRNEIRQEELRRLEEEEGLTLELIQEVKMKYFGVQDQEIQKLTVLKTFSTHTFDEKSEDFEQEVNTFLTGYYQLKGIPENRISKLVNSDKDDDDLVNILTEAQKDLAVEYRSLEANITSRVESNQREAKRLKEEREQKTLNLLSQSGFAGRTQKELEIVKKALTDKTEIVTGTDGKKYRTTLYNKRRLEASQTLEKELEYKINFILGGDSTVVENKVREQTTKKLLNRLNDHISVDVKKTDTKGKAQSISGYNIERKEIN